MVRGNNSAGFTQVVRRSSGKRTSNIGKSATAPSPVSNSGSIPVKSSQKSASPPSSSQSLLTPTCSGCKISVTDDTKALQCDKCLAPNIWKCADCLGLSDDMYDRLVTDPNNSLRWFCEQCENAVMTKPSAVPQIQNDKIDQLIMAIEKLVEKYDSIEQRLADKCDVGEVVKLESNMRDLEKKVVNGSQDINLRVQALELKVQTAETAGPEGGNTAEACHDNGVSDEELIKFVVQKELQKKIVVEKDLESRKKNIIIYRVPEKKTEVVAERRQNDLVFVTDLLDGVFDMKLDEKRHRKDVPPRQLARRQGTPLADRIPGRGKEGSYHV